MRMRQSISQFESAFEQETSLERRRREQLRRRAANRSRARRITRTEQEGKVRFSVLAVCLTRDRRRRRRRDVRGARLPDGLALARRGDAARRIDSRADGPTLSEAAAEPDPRLGPPGPDRRLDRPPARDQHLGAARVPQPARPLARRRGGRLRAKSTCATRSRPRSRPRRPRRRPTRPRRTTRTSRPTRTATAMPRATATATARRTGRAAGAVAVAAVAAAAAKSSRRPSTTARPTATASGSTRRSKTTPSTPSTGPASATVTVRIEADQIVIRRAGAGRRDESAPSPTTRRATARGLRPASWRPPAKSPRRAGRARRRRRRASARRRSVAGATVDRDLQAPVGAGAVELGQLGGGEGRADPTPQLVADGVDDPVGAGGAARGSSIAWQVAPALLPLEERVLDRVGHRGRGYARPRSQRTRSARRIRGVGDFRAAGRWAGPQARRGRVGPWTFQTVTWPLSRVTGLTAPLAAEPAGLRRGNGLLGVDEVEERRGDQVVEVGVVDRRAEARGRSGSR